MDTFYLIDTWNGGKGGERLVFTGTENACMAWVHANRPYSFYEAVTNQGLTLLPMTCARCGERWPCSDCKRTDISGIERARHHVRPLRTCERCGALNPDGQSCGCFDNASQ